MDAFIKKKNWAYNYRVTDTVRRLDSSSRPRLGRMRGITEHRIKKQNNRLDVDEPVELEVPQHIHHKRGADLRRG